MTTKNPSPTQMVKQAGQQPVARNKINALGLEAICDKIASGTTLRGLSRDLGVSVGALCDWVESDAERSARVTQARIQSAHVWDEMAEEEIRKASDPFEITRARELASHYRWRAKVVSPRVYGDKVTQEHTGAGGGPITMAAVDLKNLSDAELANMQAMLSKVSGG